MPIPQLGLRLIRRHQLHGGMRDGIYCGQQHSIGGMDVPAGDTVRLVAQQGRDRRLVIAEAGGEIGEVMAQYIWRDIGRRIAQVGDPRLYLANPTIGMSPRELANTTHRRSSAGR